MDIFRRILPVSFGGHACNFDEQYENHLVDNINSELNLSNDAEQNEHTNTKCERRIGIITKLFPDYGIIDDKFYFDTKDLQQRGVQAGQRVRFVIFRSSANVDWRVKQISMLEEDESTSGSNRFAKSRITSVNDAAQEIIHAKVEGKRGTRIFTTNIKNVYLDMETLECEFSPMIGDYVALTVFVEKKNDQKNYIEVLRLNCTETEIFEGLITDLDVDDCDEISGIIENEIFFKACNSCMEGYVPKLRDKVRATVIESDQGDFDKRAIKMVPLETNDNAREGEPAIPTLQTEKDYDSKNGIILKSSCDKQFLKMGESTVFEIVVENTSVDEKILIEIELKNSKSTRIMNIVEQFEYPISIQPTQSFIFHVNAMADNSGTYSDILLLYFEGNWNMGKLLEIESDIDEKISGQSAKVKQSKLQTEYNRSHPKSAAYALRLENIRKTIPAPVGFHVPGIRPTKPAAFIPIQLPPFPIPDSIRAIVTGDGEAIKKNSDIQNELQLAYPAMVEELNPNNYLLKFHNLLHLEDLELSITIKKYDKERVRFEKAGDFLILEIPNLAESRPSLIVGDTLQAWDANVTEPGKIIRYEAYIHKILNNAIRLKFSEAYHQNYDGREYTVTFKHSRTSIRRFHQAVNVIMDRMGPEWLFPQSLVNLKTPQINIIAEVPPTSIDPVESHECISLSKIPKIVDNARPKKKMKSLKEDALAALLDSDSDLETERKEVAIRLEDITPSVYSDNLPINHNYIENRPVCKEVAIDWVEGDRRKGKRIEKSATTKLVEASLRCKGFPIKCRDVSLHWINVALNHYQKEAVRNILKGVARPSPYVIFGPPGTGKTVTVVETILQIMFLIPESRILVAAPSNSSADLICERLLSWNLLEPGDVIRSVGYNYMAEDRMPEVIKSICTCIDTKNTDRNGQEVSFDEEGIKYSTREAVGKYRIIVSTCSSIGSLYAMGFPSNHFTHIIIDEAGQATEPEIMVPFAFMNDNSHAILAGDPLQLGPVITSKVADVMGLGESFLSRLLVTFPYHRDPESFPDTDGYDPSLVTRLLYNYRSVPNILDLYSILFYESKLLPRICGVCSEERQLVEKLEATLQENAWHNVQEILFHGIKGKNIQDDDSPSWYNQHECSRVVSYMVALHNSGVKNDDIGIVTPYQKQVMKIREILRYCQIDVPKVGTVEEFQGQERMVIIVSTVRSDEGLLDKDRRYALGFVASKQRVNVAISRAKALLIIVGNPHLLCMDSTWRNLIRICHKRGYYVGCDLPASVID